MDKTATRERRGRQAVEQTNTPHPRTFFLKRHVNNRVVWNLKVRYGGHVHELGLAFAGLPFAKKSYGCGWEAKDVADLGLDR